MLGVARKGGHALARGLREGARPASVFPWLVAHKSNEAKTEDDGVGGGGDNVDFGMFFPIASIGIARHTRAFQLRLTDLSFLSLSSWLWW